MTWEPTSTNRSPASRPCSNTPTAKLSLHSRGTGVTPRTQLSQTHTGKWCDTKRKQNDTTGRPMNMPLAGLFKQKDIILIPPQAVGDTKAIYLVKLEGPLDCAETIQTLGKMSELQAVKEGSGATKYTCFCMINGEVKATIAWALKSHPSAPTFIGINMAAKNLSDSSFAPTQGICDPMLLDDANHVSLPTQDQYPVWYFVYSNLNNPQFLVLKLGLSETPVLRPAMIKGGIVKIWKGKY